MKIQFITFPYFIKRIGVPMCSHPFRALFLLLMFFYVPLFGLQSLFINLNLCHVQYSNYKFYQQAISALAHLVQSSYFILSYNCFCTFSTYMICHKIDENTKIKLLRLELSGGIKYKRDENFDLFMGTYVYPVGN